MEKIIRGELSDKGIQKIIDELELYEREIYTKCKKFCEIMADKGIEIAKGVTSQDKNYGKYIAFSKEFERNDHVATIYIVAKPTEMLDRSYVISTSEIFAEVNPLLMAEFGSGWEAKNYADLDGVGQGTFPGQIHAFDPEGWWWVDYERYDENGKEGIELSDGRYKHHSMGESPSMPMWSTVIGLVFEIDDAIKRAFK